MCSLLFILFYLHNQYQSPILNTFTKEDKKYITQIKGVFRNCATISLRYFVHYYTFKIKANIQNLCDVRFQ